MKYKAVLFDVDGVLYDSMPLHAKSWVEAYKEFGIKLNSKLVYIAAGMPDVKAALFMTPKISKKTAEELSKLKVKLFNAYKKPPLINGAKSLIKYLQRQNIHICLVTGSSQSSTIKRLKDDFGINKEDIITGTDAKHGKPHPEPYLKALKKIKVKANEAVVIEDAPLGIQSARNAKIKCIVVKTGPISKAKLEESGADLILRDCKSVLRWFQKHS